MRDGKEGAARAPAGGRGEADGVDDACCGRTCGAGVTDARMVVLLLGAGYALKWADAQLLSVALPALKSEFRLSDTALGALGGLPFALFYSVLGVPLARLAEHRSRRGLVAISIATFSALTTLTAAATSFASLFAIRVGVAVGEAGATPAAQSLINDLAPAARRGLAFSVYAAAANAGLLLGFAGGGLLDADLGWRAAFAAFGVPGLLLALLTRIALPPETRAAIVPASRPSIGAGLAVLLREPAFRHVVAGGSLASIAAYAALAWVPSFLARSHGMGAGASGLFLGLTSGVGGGAGALAIGVLADRAERRAPGAMLRVVAAACLVAFPFLLAFYLAPGRALPWYLFLVPACLGAAHAGPSAAAIGRLAPPGLRAIAYSLLLLSLNVAASLLGNVATGVLSDALAARFGTDALRVALTLTTGVLPWAAWHFHRAARLLARPQQDGFPGAPCFIRT